MGIVDGEIDGVGKNEPFFSLVGPTDGLVVYIIVSTEEGEWLGISVTSFIVLFWKPFGDTVGALLGINDGIERLKSNLELVHSIVPWMSLVNSTSLSDPNVSPIVIGRVQDDWKEKTWSTVFCRTSKTSTSKLSIELCLLSIRMISSSCLITSSKNFTFWSNEVIFTLRGKVNAWFSKKQMKSIPWLLALFSHELFMIIK